MRKVILVEVSTPETTMWKLYDKFVTVHKEVVHLYGFQQQSTNIVQTFKGINTAITHVYEWTMRYKGATHYLQKIMKPQADLEKA